MCKRNLIVFVILALTFTIFIRYTWLRSGGLMFSPDSVHYLDIAQSIANGEGVTTYHLNLDSKTVPDRAVPWPPLYPLLLSIPLILGSTPMLAAVCITIIVNLTISLFLFLTIRRKTNWIIGIIGLVIYILFQPNFHSWDFAWSEGTFTLFLVVYFYIFDRKYYADWRYLILLGLISSLAALTRYAGLTLVGFSIGYLLIEGITTKLRLRAISIRVFMYFIGCAPLALWCARNLLLTNKLFGFSYPQVNNDWLLVTKAAFWENAHILKQMGWPVMVTIALFLYFAFMRLILKKRVGLKHHAEVDIVSIAGFMCLYVLFIVRSVVKTPIDPIGYRYFEVLIPLYIILLLLVINLVIAHLNGYLRGAILVLILVMVLNNISVSALVNPAKVNPHNQGMSDFELWLVDNTTKSDLLIGRGIWDLRLSTKRIVLESGYPHVPELDPNAVYDFINKNDNYFDRYLLISDLEMNEADFLDYLKSGFVTKVLYNENGKVVVELVRF